MFSALSWLMGVGFPRRSDGDAAKQIGERVLTFSKVVIMYLHDEFAFYQC